MPLINLTSHLHKPGGIIVRIVPDVVHIQTWAGDVELTAQLDRTQAAKLLDALQSRLATFMASGCVKKFESTDIKIGL